MGQGNPDNQNTSPKGNIGGYNVQVLIPSSSSGWNNASDIAYVFGMHVVSAGSWGAGNYSWQGHGNPVKPVRE